MTLSTQDSFFPDKTIQDDFIELPLGEKSDVDRLTALYGKDCVEYGISEANKKPAGSFPNVNAYWKYIEVVAGRKHKLLDSTSNKNKSSEFYSPNNKSSNSNHHSHFDPESEESSFKI